jgi:hypothetical protein
VTAIEFPGASDRTAVSGDKRGGVAVWDFEAVAERATFRPHAANVNTLRAYGPGSLIASTGSDGALKLIDVSERAVVSTPLHLNPGGWIDGVSDEKTWGQLAGLDVAAERGLMVGQKRVRGQWPRARAALADLPPLSLPLPQRFPLSALLAHCARKRLRHRLALFLALCVALALAVLLRKRLRLRLWIPLRVTFGLGHGLRVRLRQ